MATEDLCGEIHPEHPDVLCDLPPRHYTEHATRTLVDGKPVMPWGERIPPPSRRRGGDRKKLADMAGNTKPTTTAGPPVYGEKPYAGSSGASGSDTSHDRARYRDESGITGETQRFIWRLIDNAGYVGCTSKELRENAALEIKFPGIHHGTISGALSNLNKTGHLIRLAVKRDGNQVYVTPSCQGDRPEAPQRRGA